jgi:alkanesulfonate monooxygenase SsuD/methylene tetrahydromethanopterin reductase-like flavin-dependent oxidoreductase (luciferase family)
VAAEHQAFGVAREDRAAIFDEALPLIRRLWREDDVDHSGEHFAFRGLTVRPKPIQPELDVWLGGRASSELRRCGRLGDGWLASFMTAAECADRRPVIEEASTDAGRCIDAEHFGAMVLYARESVPDALRQRVATVRPEARADDLVAIGPDRLRTRLGEYVDVGFSKLVVVPLDETGASEGWDRAMSTTASAVLDLQT